MSVASALLLKLPDEEDILIKFGLSRCLPCKTDRNNALIPQGLTAWNAASNTCKQKKGYIRYSGAATAAVCLVKVFSEGISKSYLFDIKTSLALSHTLLQRQTP